MQRAMALACTLPKDSAPSCSGQVFVGNFFDGISRSLNNQNEKPMLESAKHLNVIRFFLCLLLSVFLSACMEEEKIGLSYHAYNHTDKSIVSIVINGEGGVLGASAHGEGSGVCCVVLPQKWRPGLMATIKWQEDDIPIFNPDGTRKIIDGIPVSSESPWKERIVEVPKYGPEMGTFFIHFFRNDDVNVLVANRWAGFEGHPYPHPDGTYQKQ